MGPGRDDDSVCMEAQRRSKDAGLWVESVAAINRPDATPSYKMRNDFHVMHRAENQHSER